jgi:predicted helicase
MKNVIKIDEDVANIARQHMMRIKVMLDDKTSETYDAFSNFLIGLHQSINNSISEEQAIEMLAQHLIIRPVFEALFDSYSFVNNNPVSRGMNEVLNVMDEKCLMKEQECLEKFYENVRLHAEGIDNLEAKQEIIIQLYEKFFKVGFKETTERLGIVFTPVEVVDFIIHSVDDVLKKHFGKSISDEGVHVLDPFTGTGTFIVRLLQSGLIKKEDLLRKYTQELHANEIVLLSYYIAAINIEETFHSLSEGDYKPFEGIVLTDTFESTEREHSLDRVLFNENNAHLKRQQKEPIFAIIGNPPYSVGQKSTNDNNANQEYKLLDEKLKNTYVAKSNVQNKNSLYDSYIKAFRWSSDRIKDKGIIGFITNASFIDSTSADGLRKCWHEEFNYIYIFNLRGNANSSGEQRKKESGNVFGSGSKTPVAITLLIKDGSDNHQIFYHDIGDYLSRDEKLSIIAKNKSISNLKWSEIIPDKHNDWINQRDERYEEFIPFINEVKQSEGVFNEQHTGVSASRDPWVTGFSKRAVKYNANFMAENYNAELERLKDIVNPEERYEQVNKTKSFIKWSEGLEKIFKRGKKIVLDNQEVILISFRPFCKKWLFYNDDIIERPRQFKSILPYMEKIIYIQGQGSSKDFSPLITDLVPNYQYISNGKGFPMYIGEDFSGKIPNLTSSIKEKLDLDDESTFNYLYAILHSKEYCIRYESDLKKAFPRIPILKNKDEFVEIGKKLADLHLNYENVAPYEGVEVIQKSSNPSYHVTKMKFGKIRNENKKLVNDKSTIIFNSDITISNIPQKAYEYVVNGRSAIEWVIDQYQIKTDKESGFIDDPNLFSEDEKYIFNLLLSVINVSVQTVDLVNNLPPLEIDV